MLEGEDLHEQVRGFLDDDVIEGYVDAETGRRLPRGLGPRAALDRAAHALPGRRHARRDRSRPAGGARRRSPREFLTEELRRRRARAPTTQREEALGAEVMRELERRVVLSVLDRKWREHLYEMDYLQEGIGLRAMAQRDPLVEYQREGFDLFNAMMEAHQGGVGRLPVQRRGRGRRAARCRRRRRRGGRRGRGARGPARRPGHRGAGDQRQGARAAAPHAPRVHRSVGRRRGRCRARLRGGRGGHPRARSGRVPRRASPRRAGGAQARRRPEVAAPGRSDGPVHRTSRPAGSPSGARPMSCDLLHLPCGE